ncbi:MAG: alpha/beta hydrolase [Bacteroidales bacterium]|nr:alpha/beta hydrolase [Bacteroidales bacterium]
MKLITTIKGFFYFSLLSISCLKYPEEKSYIDVNGQHLFYVMRGPADGKPVVLLHGNGGSHRSLRTQAMELAKAGYRVYSPDSRGQGANPVLDEYHYADMAEDSFCFIEKLGLEKPAVYGWSDGGILALMLEMSHPGTCGLLAISGANLYPDCGPDFEEFKLWILRDGSPLAMMMLKEPDIKPEELSAIKCPVLVTAGSKDLISVEHTTLIADSLPDSELVIFEGETHSSFIKKSPKVGRKMLQFFKQHNY